MNDAPGPADSQGTSGDGFAALAIIVLAAVLVVVAINAFV